MATGHYLTFRVGPELKDELGGAAAGLGMSASQLMRMGLLDVVEQAKASKEDPTKLRDLMRLAARAHDAA